MQMRNVQAEVVEPSYAADLPARILETIFTILRSRSCFIGSHGHSFQASWVPAASWVCRRWREVALATPKLWSSIDITVKHCNPDAVNTFFERAGDESLSVSIDGSALDMPAACALVQPHGQRVFHLTVELEESQTETMEVLLMHMGPKLETLQIFCSVVASKNDLTFDPQIVPNLRTLSVADIFVRPTSKLHSLTDLTLQSLWGVESKKQKHSEYFYEILSACPNLEDLDLFNALPGGPQLHNKSAAVVEFPKLRGLWVNELAIDMPANLANIITPPSATLSINARYDGCPPEWNKEDAVLPMDTLPHSRFDNFPALAETRDLSLELGARCCVPDIRIRGGNWTVSIPTMEDANNDVNRLPEFMAHVLNGLPGMVAPAQLVYLQLHIAQHMPEYTNWAVLLAHFPNVLALTIGGRRAFNGVVSAMRAYGAALLPRMLQLTVCVVASVNADTATDAKAFGRWLAERANEGKRLVALIVRVPVTSPNITTIRLASSLVAYMAVRGGRVRVECENCAVCHGRHQH